MVTTSFPVSKGSTGGIFIKYLIDHFDENINVTVLTPAFRNQIEYENVEYFRYAPSRWQILAHRPGGLPEAMKNNKILLAWVPFFFLSMLISCIRTAKTHDIIHANWGINGAVAGIAGFLTKTPVVTTLRGADVKRLRHSRIDRYLMMLCCKTNEKIVSVNQSICDAMIQSFPRWSEKFISIPNGVGLEFFKIATGRYNSDMMLELITIGSLIQRKGVDTILEAMSLMEEKAKVRLTIIGEGPLRKKLESRAHQLNIAEQVVFIGQVAHSEISGYLEKAHVFIIASFSEGRPNVVLEAMSSGLTVIASDIEGMEELIRNEENGLIFKPGNPVDLSNQIKRLTHSPELAESLAKTGRQSILSKGLTWKNTAVRYARLYEDCI